ncbi:MAG: hypothetical protein Q9227_007389 [Pyrenula ochraceoflavens]
MSDSEEKPTTKLPDAVKIVAKPQKSLNEIFIYFDYVYAALHVKSNQSLPLYNTILDFIQKDEHPDSTYTWLKHAMLPQWVPGTPRPEGYHPEKYWDEGKWIAKYDDNVKDFLTKRFFKQEGANIFGPNKVIVEENTRRAYHNDPKAFWYKITPVMDQMWEELCEARFKPIEQPRALPIRVRGPRKPKPKAEIAAEDEARVTKGIGEISMTDSAADANMTQSKTRVEEGANAGGQVDIDRRRGYRRDLGDARRLIPPPRYYYKDIIN